MLMKNICSLFCELMNIIAFYNYFYEYNSNFMTRNYTGVVYQKSINITF